MSNEKLSLIPCRSRNLYSMVSSTLFKKNNLKLFEPRSGEENGAMFLKILVQIFFHGFFMKFSSARIHCFQYLRYDRFLKAACLFIEKSNLDNYQTQTKLTYQMVFSSYWRSWFYVAIRYGKDIGGKLCLILFVNKK
jgi:hypothetical protein